MANENGLPSPSAIWLALGIIVAAIAETLGPRRKARFFSALRSLADEHERRSGVLVFGHARNHRKLLPQAARIAVAWLRRLTSELEDGAGR